MLAVSGLPQEAYDDPHQPMAMDSAAPAPTTATDPAAYVGPFADKRLLGEPFAFYVGLVLLLVLLRFASEHSDMPQGANMRVNVYNMLAVGLSSIITIITLKLVFAKYPVPGISPLIASV